MLKFVSFDVVFQEIPDEVTLAINLSNCPNRCDGCHSPWLRTDIGEILSKEIVSKLLGEYGENITCICFMGGDAAPFEVAQIAEFIHITTPNLKVAWYSGVEKLPENFPYRQFQFIKLGGYKKELGDLKNPNTNQRLYRIETDGKMTDITCRFFKNKRIL